MRLFEVAHNRFQDDLLNILNVMQGRANAEHTPSVIPWSAINNMLKPLGYAEVNNDMLSKIKDQIDPHNEIIQDINERGIVLKTEVGTPEEPKSIGGIPEPKSVDQMAHNVVSKGL